MNPDFLNKMQCQKNFISTNKSITNNHFSNKAIENNEPFKKCFKRKLKIPKKHEVSPLKLYVPNKISKNYF